MTTASDDLQVERSFQPDVLESVPSGESSSGKGMGIIMKFLNKMERKFGRYAIHNLSMGLILCYAAGYLLQLISPTFMSYLTLNPYLILHGQVWRLFSWILIPPESFSFFTLIMLYFYYSIGTNLERTWGAFRYNLYILTGMICTVIGSFILMAIGYHDYPELIQLVGDDVFFTSYNYAGNWFLAFSTYYINMSIMLAFAATFPNVSVYLMYILPIKIKYLGIIYAVILAYEFIQSNLIGRIVIGASLLNFVVFFLMTRNYQRVSPQQIHRRNEYKRQVRNAGRGDNVVQMRGRSVVTRHRCAVCGRTELDDENLEFRFCSKCDGNYEYCMDHLYTHEHVHKTQNNEEREIPH